MPDRWELRARDPVARCLIRRLVVPRVYFEADWPGGDGRTVDVLAIDRDGVGDAHVVGIKGDATSAQEAIARLQRATAPFRWLAVRAAHPGGDPIELPHAESLFAVHGAGRVGVIEVVEMASGELGANLRIVAERFPDAVHEMTVTFSRSHPAHIQFGE